MKKIKILTTLFVLVLFFIPYTCFGEHSPKDQNAENKDKKEKEDSMVKLYFSVEIPEFIVPAAVEIQYAIGYGRGSMEEVIKKDTVVLELEQKTTAEIEMIFIDRDKLDLDKWLLIDYKALLSSPTLEENTRCGGYNSVSLKSMKKLQRVGLKVKYITEVEKINCYPVME